MMRTFKYIGPNIRFKINVEKKLIRLSDGLESVVLTKEELGLAYEIAFNGSDPVVVELLKELLQTRKMLSRKGLRDSGGTVCAV